MTDNRIKIVATFGVAAILLLSLFFSPLAAGWGAEPGVYILFFAVLGCFVPAVIGYMRRYNDFSLTRIDLVVLLFGLYMICRQIPLGIERMQNDLLLSFVVLFFFYVACRAMIKTPGLINAVFIIVIVYGCGEFLIGCYQLAKSFNGENKLGVTGTFTNANTFCAFLTVCLPFVYQLLSHPPTNQRKQAIFIRIALIVLALGTFSMIFFLGSRGAITAAVTALLIFYLPFLKAVWRRSSSLKKWVIATLIMQGLIYAFFLMIEKRDSANGREFVWLRCLEMIKENPAFGYGWGGFEKEYMFFQERYFSANPKGFYTLLADDIAYPFNILLEVTIATGIIGLILFAVINVLVFSVKAGQNKAIVITCWGVLATFLTNGFFSYTLQSTPILLILFFCLAVLTKETKPLSSQLNSWFLIIPIVFVIAVMVYLVPLYTGHRHWKKGVEHILTDEDYGLEQYDLAYRNLNHRGTFLYNYGTTLFELRKYSKSKEVLEKTGLYMNTTYLQVYRAKAEDALSNAKGAEQFYKTAINMTPKLFYPRFYLLQLYINTDQKDKAKILAEKILSLPEKVISNHTRSIKEFASDYLQGKSSD